MKRIYAILGIVIALGIICIIYLAVIEIISTDITVLLVTGIFGIVGWFVKSEHDKEMEYERRVYDMRREVYLKFLALQSYIQLEMKAGRKPDQDKLTQEMVPIRDQIIVLASDKVIQHFIKWNEYAKYATENENMEPAKAIVLNYNLILEMRRDVGFPDTKLGPEDLMKVAIIDYEANKETFEKYLQG